MTTLTTHEMLQIQGGTNCATLAAITAISCMVGFLWACGLGLVGGVALCSF